MSSTPYKQLKSNLQQYFFKNITDKQLNEFLFRSEYGILARHVQNELNIADMSYVIVSSNITKINNKISVYLNYEYDNMQKLHISFHLQGDDFNYKFVGPIHAVNNTRKHRSPFRFKLSRKLSCNISNRKTNQFSPISNPIKLYILSITKDVLNTYFIKKHPYYLDVQLATPSNKLHKFLINIIRYRKTRSTPIIQTQLTLHLV
jgi:hypothetical protein